MKFSSFLQPFYLCTPVLLFLCIFLLLEIKSPYLCCNKPLV